MTMTDIATVAPIDRHEMARLAGAEYERLLDLLRSLEAAAWSRQTVCDAWDVRLMVAHLLGAAESNASVVENVRQLVKGRRRARAMGAEIIDGINAVQVDARSHLTPDELLAGLEAVAPRAIRGRMRTPAPLRRARIEDGIGGTMTIGHLVDVVYTRDQWMHRMDISDAVDREPLVTADHDGRIVADVVREWAEGHGEPFELELTGPAGGYFVAGEGGPVLSIDAVEFCLVLSGRLDKELPLARPVVF